MTQTHENTLCGLSCEFLLAIICFCSNKELNHSSLLLSAAWWMWRHAEQQGLLTKISCGNEGQMVTLLWGQQNNDIKALFTHPRVTMGYFYGALIAFDLNLFLRAPQNSIWVCSSMNSAELHSDCPVRSLHQSFHDQYYMSSGLQTITFLWITWLHITQWE